MILIFMNYILKFKKKINKKNKFKKGPLIIKENILKIKNF